MTTLQKALNEWYTYDGFALAQNREEQLLARAYQQKLANKVKELLLGSK